MYWCYYFLPTVCRKRNIEEHIGHPIGHPWWAYAMWPRILGVSRCLWSLPTKPPITLMLALSLPRMTKSNSALVISLQSLLNSRTSLGEKRSEQTIVLCPEHPQPPSKNVCILSCSVWSRIPMSHPVVFVGFCGGNRARAWAICCPAGGASPSLSSGSLGSSFWLVKDSSSSSAINK